MAELIPGTGKQRAGKSQRLIVHGIPLVVNTMKATHKADDLGTENFESGGFAEGIVGFESLECSFGGDWDAGQDMREDPPGIYPRNDLPDLQLILNTRDNSGWLLPWARVLSASNGGGAKDKVPFEASLMSNGIFYPLTGSV